MLATIALFVREHRFEIIWKDVWKYAKLHNVSGIAFGKVFYTKDKEVGCLRSARWRRNARSITRVFLNNLFANKTPVF